VVFDEFGSVPELTFYAHVMNIQSTINKHGQSPVIRIVPSIAPSKSDLLEAGSHGRGSTLATTIWRKGIVSISNSHSNAIDVCKCDEIGAVPIRPRFDHEL